MTEPKIDQLVLKIQQDINDIIDREFPVLWDAHREKILHKLASLLKKNYPDDSDEVIYQRLLTIVAEA